MVDAADPPRRWRHRESSSLSAGNFVDVDPELRRGLLFSRCRSFVHVRCRYAPASERQAVLLPHGFTTLPLPRLPGVASDMIVQVSRATLSSGTSRGEPGAEAGPTVASKGLGKAEETETTGAYRRYVRIGESTRRSPGPAQ